MTNKLISQKAPPIETYFKNYPNHIKIKIENYRLLCYINIHSINRNSEHINLLKQLLNSKADLLISVEKQKDMLLSTDTNFLSVFYSGRFNNFNNIDNYLYCSMVLSYLVGSIIYQINPY